MLPAEDAEEIRHDTCRILRTTRTPTSNVSRKERQAHLELQNNNSIVIVKADKGNATVVLNRIDYKIKMDTLLDPQQYRKLNKDPTTKNEQQTRKAIKNSQIPSEDQKRLLPTGSQIPRLYGLPKIQREGHPLRPIVSIYGSPTYESAKYIAKKLQPYTELTNSFVNNSEHFVEILKKH